MTGKQKAGTAAANPGKGKSAGTAKRPGRAHSRGNPSGKSDSREFFRIGAQLGIPWFRLYLSDSLVEKYPGGTDSPRAEGSALAAGISPGETRGELLRWFILHLAIQAGSGHLRSSLENIEEEMGEWYTAAGFRGAARGGSPPKGFDETLPGQLARAVPALIETGLDSGLIGQLPKEDSPGEILELPRPPLALTADGRFIYFLRRRKEEDRFLAALEERSRMVGGADRSAHPDANPEEFTGTAGQSPQPNQPAHPIANPEEFTGIAGQPDQPNRSAHPDANPEAFTGTAGQPDQPNRAILRVHPAFTAALPRANPATPEGALVQGLANRRRLLLLAGGPGTGKTTTVARLLEFLNPVPGSLEVILAAPTGRAAARMTESLKLSGKTAGRTIHSLLGLYPGRPPRHDADRPLAADLCIVDEASMVDLPLMNALLAALPESAALLLVGDPDQLPSVEAGAVLGDLLYGAAEAAEAAGVAGAIARAAAEERGAPLSAGIVGVGGSSTSEVVPRGKDIPDEKVALRVEDVPESEAASQGKDVPEYEASPLEEDVPESEDIPRAESTPGEEDSPRFGEAAPKAEAPPRPRGATPKAEATPRTGDAAPKDEGTPRRKGPLTGAVVKLTKVYRSDTAILEAASAVREGDFEALKDILAKPSGAVRLYPTGSPDAMARIIAQEFRGFRETAAPAAESFVDTGAESVNEFPNGIPGIFAGFAARAVLSPLRRGPWGVPAMNERIAWLLGGTASPFPGMPVMITRNDPTRNLWNGDRGVLVLSDGRLRAAFPEADGMRNFPIAALPGWEPAWVQTIHKSQGSEFDSVTILLPEGAERLLSREILYTAFTRARHSVKLYADVETVEAALERRVVRHSRIREWASGR